MSLIVKDDGTQKEFESCPAGTYQAICIGVYDIGEQESNFNGEKSKRHQVLFCFEVDVRMEHGEYKGKRFVISKRYNWSLFDKSTLRKDLESWRGKKFDQNELKSGIDLEKCIGLNCLISITQNGKYTNVGAVLKITSNIPPIKQETVWENIPNWILKLQQKGGLNATPIGMIDKEESTKISKSIDTDYSVKDFDDVIPF